VTCDVHSRFCLSDPALSSTNLTRNRGLLIFTVKIWNILQPGTIDAGHNGNAVNDLGIINLTASGGG